MKRIWLDCRPICHAEARALTPLVVHVDGRNRVVKIGNDRGEPVPGSTQKRGDLVTSA